MVQEKKFFSKKNIMGMIIVFLMVFSVLGIWQGSQSTVEYYNSFKVTQEGSKYVVKTDYGNVKGYTFPAYVEGIPLDTTLPVYVALQYSPVVTILFDPQDSALPYIEVLRLELAQEDLPLLSKTASFAVTQKNETYPYPVANCSSTAPIIYLRTTNSTLNPNATTRIYEEQNCLVLESISWRDLVGLKDRLVYTLSRIMK